MKSYFVIVSFVTLALTTAVMAQTVSHPTDKHPYTFALEYCQGKGGLARFTQENDKITFSCADDLTKLITITAR